MSTTMNSTMSCFRLLDLPLDLLELLTLYFNDNQAVKLLKVSSNFHEIFARSVWRTVTLRTFGVIEPVRSRAFARYGHLVRSIQIYSNFDAELGSYNWAQLFPNTTSMVFDILYDMKYGIKQAFMDAVASLHGLRSLEINTNSNTPPFDLETLATMLVTRHHDPSKQSLRELIIAIRTGEDNGDDGDNGDNEEKLWNDLSSFVQTLSSLRPSINLKIDMSEYDCISVPTPAQMNIPRPYLACAPSLDDVEDEYGCKALLYRQLFSPSGTRDDPLVFDRLDRLYISVCCALPLLYDYCDFTPVKFPTVEYMSITENACRHQTEEGAESAIHKSLLQKWPTLKELSFHRRGLTLDTVDKFFELNPQLTYLYLNIGPNIGDADGVFMLERVAGCLPHLTTLYLYGGLITLVDSDWLQTTSLVDTCSSKLRSISFSNFTLVHRLFEVLLALPSLHDVSFWQCVIAEPELVMNVFKKHRQTAKEGAKVGIRSLTIYIPGANNNWSTELMLEMIACLPNLKSCAFHGNDSTRSAIKEKHPHIRL